MRYCLGQVTRQQGTAEKPEKTTFIQTCCGGSSPDALSASACQPLLHLLQMPEPHSDSRAAPAAINWDLANTTLWEQVLDERQTRCGVAVNSGHLMHLLLMHACEEPHWHKWSGVAVAGPAWVPMTHSVISHSGRCASATSPSNSGAASQQLAGLQ